MTFAGDGQPNCKYQRPRCAKRSEGDATTIDYTVLAGLVGVGGVTAIGGVWVGGGIGGTAACGIGWGGSAVGWGAIGGWSVGGAIVLGGCGGGVDPLELHFGIKLCEELGVGSEVERTDADSTGAEFFLVGLDLARGEGRLERAEAIDGDSLAIEQGALDACGKVEGDTYDFALGKCGTGLAHLTGKLHGVDGSLTGVGGKIEGAVLRWVTRQSDANGFLNDVDHSNGCCANQKRLAG